MKKVFKDFDHLSGNLIIILIGGVKRYPSIYCPFSFFSHSKKNDATSKGERTVHLWTFFLLTCKSLLCARKGLYVLPTNNYVKSASQIRFQNQSIK